MKFDYNLKHLLYWSLKEEDYVKYLRWHHDKSYLKFRIYSITFKVIVSESYKPFDDLPVFNDGDWVINAAKWYSNVDDVLETIVDVTNWLIDYYNDDELQKMADYAEAKGMSPYNLGYQYIKRKDGFSISHSTEFDELINELAHKYIAHLELQDNKFGALYQIMRLNASLIFDQLIDEKENSLSCQKTS